jgi:hypothetical protein
MTDRQQTLAVKTACGTCDGCVTDERCTKPLDWIDRVLVEVQHQISAGKYPKKVWIAPEDADDLKGVEGSFGDGGIVGHVAGLPLLCTYRVRPGFWMVAE